MISIPFKTILLLIAVLTFLVSCSKDSDIVIPTLKPMLFTEDFTYSVSENSFAAKGWLLYAEAGTKNWTEAAYSGDAYAEFTSYQSGEASNIGWLISPSIKLDNNKASKLLFQIAQAYVSSSENSITVLIASNFDGNSATVLSANWIPLAFKHPTLNYDTNFEYVNSEVDLSNYAGNINIAFRVQGSGTNTALNGTYQLDNIRVVN